MDPMDTGPHPIGWAYHSLGQWQLFFSGRFPEWPRLYQHGRW